MNSHGFMHNPNLSHYTWDSGPLTMFSVSSQFLDQNLLTEGCWSFNGAEPGGLESTMRKVKEGKRLIFPGLHSRLLSSRESARNREIKRKRKKKKKKDTGAKALMEQRCFNQHGVGIYTVLQDSYSQQR